MSQNVFNLSDLHTLIEKLTSFLSKGDYKEPPVFDAVQKLIENYEGDDWKQYVIWEKSHAYSRHLISKTKYFTLMMLCWPVDIASPSHGMYTS